jgi:Family of unknown function (DUF6252)
MKQKILLLLTPLYFVLMASSCKKDKTPEDYVVHVGNHAFGVYLNGQPWVADYRDPGNGVEPISVRMIWSSVPRYNYMWIYGQKSNEEISLYIPPPLVPGRVLLNTTTYPWPSVSPNGAYGMYRIFTPEKRYMTTNTVSGYIDIISCDTILNKIEGKFHFEAINTSTNEKVTISNGYFKKN